MADYLKRLSSGGMSAQQSAAEAELLNELIRSLNERRGGCEPPRAFFVPGRLEVVGKHTDYAGGRSLVCAIERGISVVTAPRTDGQVHLVDRGRRLEASFRLDSDVEPECPDWSKYPVTVARRMARDFRVASLGADIVFASDLPRASGMSSSSALMIAVFFALAEASSLWQSEAYQRRIRSREDLAGYLAAVESGGNFESFRGDRGVGTFGGSEDHVAILCSRAGCLRQYSYCPIRLEREIAMPEGHTFVVGVSGVKAEKTGNAREAYNRISLAAREILGAWRGMTGREDASLADALASSPDGAKRLREILSRSTNPNVLKQFLQNRLAQFAEESDEIVPAVADALQRSDAKRAGSLVDRSQLLAETLLSNQTPETIEMARSARKLGAVAASGFGAGFGGSVWALVAITQADEFRVAWGASYRSAYPERAAESVFFNTGAGPGLIQFET